MKDFEDLKNIPIDFIGQPHPVFSGANKLGVIKLFEDIYYIYK